MLWLFCLPVRVHGRTLRSVEFEGWYFGILGRAFINQGVCDVRPQEGFDRWEATSWLGHNQTVVVQCRYFGDRGRGLAAVKERE